MRLESASESSPADRLLVVTGAVSGACVALSRLASATDTAGTSWLMVLIQATVAAQGGAALLWVVRAFLRWTVGRVSGSHAVRDAYTRDDTATYAVFLLTLATAIGVQLVAPVLWLLGALFVGAQAWVLRRARPRRAPTVAHRHRGAALGLHFVAGVTLMLYALTWRRLLEREVGASADLATLITAAMLVGLGVGALSGARVARWWPARLAIVFVVLQTAAALWGAASIALIPRVGTAVAGAAPATMIAAVAAIVAVPMVLMGAAQTALMASQHDPLPARDRTAGSWWGAALFGAAVAGVLAVDLLFAFTGIRGTILGSAALSLASALGAALVFTRRSAAAAQESA